MKRFNVGDFAMLLSRHTGWNSTQLKVGSIGLIKNIGSAWVLVDFNEPAVTARWCKPYQLRSMDLVERLSMVADDG